MLCHIQSLVSSRPWERVAGWVEDITTFFAQVSGFDWGALLHPIYIEVHHFRDFKRTFCNARENPLWRGSQAFHSFEVYDDLFGGRDCHFICIANKRANAWFLYHLAHELWHVAQSDALGESQWNVVKDDYNYSDCPFEREAYEALGRKDGGKGGI